jgi:hypothetical protein
LPAPSYRQTAQDGPDTGYASLAPADAPIQNVIVLRGEVFGAVLPATTRVACAHFAEAAGTELLGIDLFRAGDDRWTFASATPYPDLTLGGNRLIAHLAHLFAPAARVPARTAKSG